jgi:hypothetical protein
VDAAREAEGDAEAMSASKDQERLNEVLAALQRSPMLARFLESGFWDAASVDVVWRRDGRDVREQADWLKDIWSAVRNQPSQFPRVGRIGAGFVAEDQGANS